MGIFPVSQRLNAQKSIRRS